MGIDLSSLDHTHRLLFSLPLEPLQGRRFQPTGFPSLGAATFQTTDGQSLLVESAQSVANWFEIMIWDGEKNDVKAGLEDLSHVRVLRGVGDTEKARMNAEKREFLTDTILESHRLNSPYVLRSKLDTTIPDLLKNAFGKEMGAFDRKKFAGFLLKYDIGSLLHGVFISQSDLMGGRLRLSRSLSAFVEADGVGVAPSGGVKNDHVHPAKVQGDGENRFGNIPFARDEFTAEKITLYVNLDLAQIRGYGLGEAVERLLILLALYKLRALVDGGLRLRTACDLQVLSGDIEAARPAGFKLPRLTDLTADLKSAIATCKDQMVVTEVSFDDELKKAKEEKSAGAEPDVGEDETEA
ncbi:MAG: type I-U CRISPR-associated RAMP protein Csb1/Cas7u [Gammaproteobacteria bacterium]|nr:type I-U CRISPR-associated RAMP protein Csb1/Cas7u [Gammaproteobacteria bacterium]